MNSFNLVLPMAGRGKRFEMYDRPKLLVDVGGKPMLVRVLENIEDNLPLFCNVIYLFNKDMNDQYRLSYFAQDILQGRVIELDSFTEGAACTVLQALDYINNDSPMFTANVDQIVDYPYLNQFFNSCLESSNDGTILTYPSSEPYHSFVEVRDGLVTKVAEKEVISNHATIGIYHWTKGSDFVRSATKMIAKNIRYKDEFYLAPVYNQGIEDGKKYGIYEIPTGASHIIGTPQTLNDYTSTMR